MEELDKIGQEVLIIDGNHETVVELRKAASATKNVTFFNAKTRRIGNFLVIGYGVNGFSLRDQHFEDFISRIKHEFQPGDKIIMLSHGPPYGTKVDLIIDQHCGSKSLMDFIEKHHPVLVISGHLHETFNVQQNLGKTFVINPGPFGKIITIN
jgi:Icc-related predicted phosphoesterase